MTEILIQLDLMTIIYFCILAFIIPVLAFSGYRIGNTIANVILVKSNNNLMIKNRKVIMENIHIMNDFKKKMEELNKKLSNDGDAE